MSDKKRFLYFAYMSGWRKGNYGPDGVDYEAHEDEEVRAAYREGWNDGYRAHQEAGRKAANKYEYHVIFVRLA